MEGHRSFVSSCPPGPSFPQGIAAGDESMPGWTQTARSFWAVHSAAVGKALVGQRVRRPPQVDILGQSRATFRIDADHRPHGEQNVSV